MGGLVCGVRRQQCGLAMAEVVGVIGGLAGCERDPAVVRVTVVIIVGRIGESIRVEDVKDESVHVRKPVHSGCISVEVGEVADVDEFTG